MLALLALEKLIQHIAVTIAFAIDAFDIRASVAVDYRWLLWLGALAAILFGIALVGLLRCARWSLGLLGLLALADLVGEFVAQGTFWITVNVSFIVALVILVLAIRMWRNGSAR